MEYVFTGQFDQLILLNQLDTTYRTYFTVVIVSLFKFLKLLQVLVHFLLAIIMIHIVIIPI